MTESEATDLALAIMERLPSADVACFGASALGGPHVRVAHQSGHYSVGQTGVYASIESNSLDGANAVILAIRDALAEGGG